MEPLIIKKTEETPAIIFNPKKGTFQIVATSWPENAKEFYEPVYNWIKDYFNNTPLENTIVQFRFNYINTASSKQVFRILTLLKTFSAKHKIKIQWIYEKGDTDMAKEGIRYKKLLFLDNIEVIEK